VLLVPPQDYSDCHESITEKLVVIDVSDVIGEAIRCSDWWSRGNPKATDAAAVGRLNL
jgi:hypothetical protein